ncbi:MAG: PDZ domain-containing protein, partial [Deltaproteobacteria bacterium]|nr:PDZ domain-containing protein [Deltaproteobacteria bacterium]
MLFARAACIITCAAVLAGCGPVADRWTGSVDAVFKYSPGNRSTLIHEIRPGSYSEQAGLLPGDRLLTVDGEDVADADFPAVRGALRGPVGTMAVLRVQRGADIVEIAIERRPL